MTDARSSHGSRATGDPRPRHPRARLSRQESQALTRRRLLEAAGRVFADKGFHAASLEDVAEEAGFSIGAVYSNFRGKDDLFLTLMDERMASLERDLANAFADDAPGPTVPADRRRDVIAAELDRLAAAEAAVPEGWWRLLNEFRTYAAAHPGTRDRLTAAERRCRDILARHIERFATAAGIALPRPADELAELSTAAVDGLRPAYAQGRSTVPASEGLRFFVASMLGVAAGGAADGPPRRDR